MRKICKYFILFILPVPAIYYFYPGRKFPEDVSIDKIVVLKSERILQVFSKGQLIKTYVVSLGGNPTGDREFEGDKRTPEGIYTINDKNANSGYHKNMGISFPDSNDIVEAKKRNKSSGGEIKIHGLKNGLGFIGKFQRWIDGQRVSREYFIFFCLIYQLVN